MTTTHGRRVEEVFHAAYELPAAERERFLDERCADDAELRREVEALLSHEEAAADAFLTGRETARPVRAPLTAGQRVGRFEIVGLIGQGGMGAVYEATQEHPRRTVALKLVRGARADEETLRRFRQEADVLAALQHAGIAQVYEAGTALLADAEGQSYEEPFFAMELVRGERLDRYARSSGLGTREQVELIARICDAVQHAHQRGIIHRDLKPDNILVVDEAAEPGSGDRTSLEFADLGQPKVLDFGIARVTGPEAGRTTLETRAGHLVGTLEFMSPEQVAGDPRSVDTRSDVYALGVLLFELLVGRPPLDLADAPLLECARRIREEPPASLRSVDPRAPSELEAVCGMALEKDAEDRYPSAGELAADLRRYLRGEPVAARSHSTFYVVRKTLRRHRTAAAVGTLVVALLVAFGVVSSIQARRNQGLARGLRTELAAGNIERGRVLARTGSLEAAEGLIWREHLRDPDSRHSFWALWELYALQPSFASLPTRGGETRAIDLQPGGSLFAEAGDDARIRLWDPVRLRLVTELEAPATVFGLDFHPDGRRIASAHVDGSVWIWDVEERRALHTLAAHGDVAWGVRFATDGRALVSCGADGIVAVWDAETGARVASLNGHEREVRRLAVTPDGGLLASGGLDDDILLWRLPETEPVARLRAEHGWVRSLAFSTDGATLASGGDDKRIHLWDVATGERLRTLGVQSTRWLGFPPGRERTLVSCGFFRTSSWNLESGTLQRSIGMGNMGGLLRQAGALVLCSGAGNVLRLWEEVGGGRIRLTGHSGPVASAVHPRGAWIVTGDAAGVVRVWDAATGELLATHPVHGVRIRTLAFAPGGVQLAVGSQSGELLVMDATSGEIRWRGGDGRHLELTPASLAFTPDGAVLAHISLDGVVILREARTGQPIGELSIGRSEAVGLAFHPDGGELAVTSRDNRVQRFSLEGELLGEVRTPTGPWTPRYSDDGTRLAISGWGNQLYVLDLATDELTVLRGHRALVRDVAFRPGDADTLVSSSGDGTVKLWDLVEERCLATLDVSERWEVNTVAFGPDGTTIVAATRDEALIWDLTHFERHMAGNLRWQLELLEPELGGPVPRERLELWADEVLARPWPRFPVRGQ